MIDWLSYSAPFGIRSRIAERLVLTRHLRRPLEAQGFPAEETPTLHYEC
ncbi:hypothetical protein [Rathayibacter agropyri]|nr:hypothetical protein [Rathayibacter agropyri]NRD09317.1 hypothetical protein [Rathayibacter agropyri]